MSDYTNLKMLELAAGRHRRQPADHQRSGQDDRQMPKPGTIYLAFHRHPLYHILLKGVNYGDHSDRFQAWTGIDCGLGFDLLFYHRHP